MIKVMLPSRLRELISAHLRKQYFPERYPDPYDELIDYLSVPKVKALISEAQESGDRSMISIASYLSRLLPIVHFSELFRDYQEAYGQRLGESGAGPDTVFYFLRSLEAASSVELWASFHRWCDGSQSVQESWLKANLGLEAQIGADAMLLRHFHPDSESWLKSITGRLQNSSGLFAWHSKNLAPGDSLPEFIRSLRWPYWDSIADWNDFRSLAKSMVENGPSRVSPKIRRRDVGEAVMFTAPISPPSKVVLACGKAAGVLDAMRFAIEFGTSCFYTGMNPDLEAEFRISGDPALPYFWGFLFAHALSLPAGLTRIIGPAAQKLAEPLGFLLHFWYRYDSMLAEYQNRLKTTPFKEAEDRYTESFHHAFPMSAPAFLCLYDLGRADRSFYRATAWEAAAGAAERFKTAYGNQWFSATRFKRKIQDYWREGFGWSVREILADLGAEANAQIPFLPL